MKSLISRIDAIDEELIASGLSHLTCSNALWNGGLPLSSAFSAGSLSSSQSKFVLFSILLFINAIPESASSFFPQSSMSSSLFGSSSNFSSSFSTQQNNQSQSVPATLFDLLQKAPTSPSVIERIKIEHWLLFSVGEYGGLEARKVIVERIRGNYSYMMREYLMTYF